MTRILARIVLAVLLAGAVTGCATFRAWQHVDQ